MPELPSAAATDPTAASVPVQARRSGEEENTAEAVQPLIGSFTWRDLLGAKCRRQEVVFTFTYSVMCLGV